MMKYFASAFFLITFVGCSSTYRISDSPSKENFYDEFNNSFKTKETKVTLINDSTFTLNKGVEIENDTLFSFNKLEVKKNRVFALLDISEINYLSNDYQTAVIALKNGEELKAENIRTIHDSINFVEIKIFVIKNNIVPMDKVKTMSYKNRWRNIPVGAIAGLTSGGVIGLSVGYFLGEYDTQPAQQVMTDQHPPSAFEKALAYWFSGAILGLISGGIAGSVLGCDIIYQFNP